MANAGEILRRERERRKIALADIAAATKISVRMLQAIETETFRNLPGGIFNRSFVRTYATYVGLDPEAVLREFLQDAGEPFEPVLELPEVPEKRRTTSKPRWAMLGVLTAALLVLSFLSWRLYRQWQAGHVFSATTMVSTAVAAAPSLPPSPNSVSAGGTVDATSPSAGAASGPVSPTGAANQPAPGTQAAAANSSDASAAVNMNTPSAGVTAANGAGRARAHAVDVSTPPSMNPSPVAPSTSASPQPQSGAPVALQAGTSPSNAPISLDIQATQDSWVSISTDGKKALRGMLAAGESRTFTAQQHIRVFTGNAGGLKLVVNGQPQPPLGKAGALAQFDYPPLPRPAEPQQ